MAATVQRVDGLCKYPLLLFMLLAGITISERAVAITDVEAMELGYRVAAVKAAIQDPTAPGAMQAITALGHDQRYYVMVRGWLAYRLQGDRSLLQANSDQPKVQARIDFLERAIRAIDLE